MKKIGFVLILMLLCMCISIAIAEGAIRVELNQTAITLALRKTTLLKAAVYDGQQKIKTPKGIWESSDESIVTVTKTGNVTAKSAGTAIIRYTYKSSEGVEESAECSVTAFIPIVSMSVAEKKLNLHVGEEYTVIPTTKPEDATFKEYEWSSSDESVATVEGGVINAVGPGTCRVKIVTTDGSKRMASLDVTVPSLYAAEKDIVIESIGEVAIPIEYYGTDPEINVSISSKGDSVDCTAEYQTNRILLKLNVRRVGMTTLIITDKGCRINGKNVSETLNIEVKDEALPDILWLQYTSVESSGPKVSYKIKNCSNYEVVELYHAVQFLNQFGEQLYEPYDEFGCVAYFYSRNEHILPGETDDSYYRADDLGSYSGITEARVAVYCFRTADGIYHYIPANRLYWYSSEKGYLDLPTNLSRCIDAGSEIRDLAKQVSLGIETGSVFSHARGFYHVLHAGKTIKKVRAQSIADKCGLISGDLIYAFDGIPWEDDPQGLDKSCAKLAKGEETVFTVEREGKLMDVTIKIE